MLPALTAVLAGALVAGTATVLSSTAAQSSADPTGLNVALSEERTPDVRGDLDRPAPSTRTSGTPSSSGAPATSSSPPATSSSRAPGSSSAAAPPPPVTSTTTATEEEPPPAPASPDTSQQDRVVSLVNTFRDRAGCGPVTVNAQLTAAAQGHAEDMSNRDYFSHTTPEGVTFDQRIRNAGYSSPGAENIARGARTAEDVMRMWMESDGHRRNILNCDLNAIGVGLERDGFYWVQNFGY